jgi:small subunit ribosomal protein S2
MNRLPGAIFIVDTKKEKIAVAEARKMGIPSLGLVDTNSDPEEIDYVIPSNDDAIRAIRLFSSRIADACLEGKKRREERLQQEAAAEPQEKTEEAPTSLAEAQSAEAAVETE